jgi:Tfp pilus assembly protein FimT
MNISNKTMSGRHFGAAKQKGFSVIELLIVVAII